MKRHLSGKNCFAVENVQFIADGELVNRFVQLGENVFCITITDLRNLAFKVAEVNHFPHIPNKADTAGRSRYYGFTRRHTQLSVRQPHAK